MGSTAATRREQSRAIRVGVVGLGYFGTFHAQKYAALPGCELVAVVDRNLEGAEKFALEHGAQVYTDYRDRSEEHTSELQSRGHLVCRLLLEKKNKRDIHIHLQREL